MARLRLYEVVMRWLLFNTCRLKRLKGHIKGLRAMHPQYGNECQQMPTIRHTYQLTIARLWSYNVVMR